MDLRAAIERLSKFVEEHELFRPTAKLLVAVSGGRDSMCLLTLVRELPNSIGVAHVNYRLRGEDSEADRTFVDQYCNAHRLPFYLKEIDLEQYAQEHHLGIQEAARRVRYDWFAELLEKQSYDILLTAHHSDDAIESFLVNVFRGTGIKGLTGIPVKRDRIVRPLLCFSRNEVDDLCVQEGIPYREDLSNLSDDYLRNRIRHHITPAIEGTAPVFKPRLLKNMERLKQETLVLDAVIKDHLKHLTAKKSDQLTIDLAGLRRLDGAVVILYHAARDYGFSWEQCTDLLSKPHQSGIHYPAGAYEMFVDRDRVLIMPILQDVSTQYTIEAGQTVTLEQGSLAIIQTTVPEHFEADPCIEYIDPALSGRQFTLRRWQPGDRFQPLGMSGSQKLQDFLTNTKTSPAVKRALWLLTAYGEIVWVVGHRLDDRFKLGASSHTALKLEWHPV